MTQIPDWWLILSGIFFGLHIVLLIALLVVVFHMIGLIKDLRGRIEALHGRVDEILVNTRETTKQLGIRATHVGDNVSLMSASLSRRVESVATIVLSLAGLLSLRKMMREKNKSARRR